MKALTIGQVARRAGVGVETLRFYERRGLVPEPPRSASGCRQYREDSVARVRFILRAKELGFSLREIGDLLSLRREPSTSCADIKRRAEAKIADIEERIQALQSIRVALARLAEQCTGQGPLGQCPVLDAMESQAP